MVFKISKHCHGALWTPTYADAYANAFNFTMTIHDEIFIHTLNQLFMSLWKLTTDQNEFKIRLKPQQNKKTAECLSS